MYKRIVLKLSGEALAGDKEGVSFDDAVVSALVKSCRRIPSAGNKSGDSDTRCIWHNDRTVFQRQCAGTSGKW